MLEKIFKYGVPVVILLAVLVALWIALKTRTNVSRLLIAQGLEPEPEK